MSNNPILPIVPNGAAPVDDSTANDEDLLPTEDPDLDDGETNDDEDQVDQDVAEANAVNDNLEN